MRNAENQSRTLLGCNILVFNPRPLCLMAVQLFQQSVQLE